MISPCPCLQPSRKKSIHPLWVFIQLEKMSINAIIGHPAWYQYQYCSLTNSYSNGDFTWVIFLYSDGRAKQCITQVPTYFVWTNLVHSQPQSRRWSETLNVTSRKLQCTRNSKPTSGDSVDPTKICQKLLCKKGTLLYTRSYLASQYKLEAQEQ